jgi:hypothetical protein
MSNSVSDFYWLTGKIEQTALRGGLSGAGKNRVEAMKLSCLVEDAEAAYGRLALDPDLIQILNRVREAAFAVLRVPLHDKDGMGESIDRLSSARADLRVAMRRVEANTIDLQLPVGIAAQPPSPYLFELVGDIWHLQFEEEKGDFSNKEYCALRYTARLLSSANILLDMGQLGALGRQASRAPASAKPIQHLQTPFTKDRKQPITKGQSFDFTRDAEGGRAVSAEMLALRKQYDEAVELNNEDAKATILIEMEKLHESESKDVNRRGKARRLGMTDEDRAAECVRKALDLLREKLADTGMPRLAEHLKKIKKENTSFIYHPGAQPPAWIVKGL